MYERRTIAHGSAICSGGRTVVAGSVLGSTRGPWRVYGVQVAVGSAVWPDRARGKRRDGPGIETARVRT
ncbi:hypothetical protein GQ457_10G008960 [Hibiscus cannabinus]